MNDSIAPPTDQTRIDALEERLDFAKRLQALTNRIHATENVWQIMLDLSEEICDLFQCERLTLYVVNKERKVLVSKIKTGINTDKELVLPINRQSVAGFVATTRTSVRINNLDDPEELKAIDPELKFFGRVDELTGFKSRQMLAAPLVQGLARELVGVLQLINQRTDGHFDSVAEDGLEALTATLALALFQRIKATALLPKRYEALAEQGVIAPPELELAQRWAQRKNKDLERVLVEDFQVPLAAIGEALAKAAGLSYQPLKDAWYPNRELARKLDKAVCQRQRWLPWELEQNLMVMIVPEAPAAAVMDGIHRAFPYNEVRLRLTTQTEFDRVFAQYFPA